jgi:hypothetical protein
MGQQITANGPNLACVCIVLKLRMVFTFLNGWKNCAQLLLLNFEWLWN